MRKRIFSLGATIVVAFLAMTFDATAQNRGPQLEAEPLATEYANKLKTSLELTDAQKTKVYDIYLAIANENIPAIKERQSQGNGQNGQGGQNRQSGQGGQSGQSTQGGQSNNQNRQGGQGGDQRSENRETPAFIFGMVFAQEGDANTKTEKAMKEVLSDGQYTKWVEIVEADRKAERPQRPQQREQR